MKTPSLSHPAMAAPITALFMIGPHFNLCASETALPPGTHLAAAAAFADRAAALPSQSSR